MVKPPTHAAVPDHVSLHRPPSITSVLAQQLKAARIALRKETAVFLVACLLLAILVVRAAFASTGKPTAYVTMSFGAGAGVPVVLIAAILPFSLWRGENPAHRSYHWSMPVARAVHTTTKVVAGLCWAWIALALYLTVFVVLEAVTTRAIGESPRYRASWWEWLVPLTATAISYALSSAVVVGVRRPARWTLASVPGLVSLSMFGDVLGLPTIPRILRAIWMGEYGFLTAAGMSLADAAGKPSVERWGVACAMWAGGALVALAIAVTRRHEPTGET